MHGEDGFQLEESYRRFRSQFGDSYEAEILYSGFGPHRGTWRITVQEGELRRWVFRNKENLPEHRDFAENLTMEVLYKRAEENDTLELSYDESGMISEIVSPSQEDGPTDRGYLIRIVSIEKTKQ
jgi:hypothetical protein